MELMACAGLVGGTTEQSCLFPDPIWYYQWYEILMNCLYYTSGLPQPFLLLISANLAQAGFLGWKWTLWPSGLVGGKTEQNCLFSWPYILLSRIWNTSETVCITPQPCHSHFCCWWLPIWPKLDFWAENGAYGLCWLGWRYNGAKMSFYWPYMILSMIWNTAELSELHLIRASAIFVVDCCQFVPSWMFGLKIDLMACAGSVGGATEKIFFFPDLIC